METKAMNRKLTQVGPGTPMGKLLRYYWWPIAGSVELGDNPVKAVTILATSESAGRIAAIGLQA